MSLTQEKLLNEIRESCNLRIALNDKEKEIESLSDILLDDLKKVKGWECLIQCCKEQYEQGPDDFFRQCYITHEDDSVSFHKSYGNGHDFTVLTINLSEELSKQVEKVKNLIKLESMNELKRTEEKERAELKRLKEKYGE